ncbi:MAG: helix-turn-helix domain-containing protein [Deltaproteobacteria bacterium]|nr:helix-turn-helix domain-containing protein [Deltaproteobacteria bacterium]
MLIFIVLNGGYLEARELGSVSRACKNCGISRKTYYKWWKIYQNSDADKDNLADRSRRPNSHPKTIEGVWKHRIGWENMEKCFEDIQNLSKQKPKRGACQGRAKRVHFTLDKKTEQRLSQLPNLHVTHV